jgi:hypothetical protein
VANPSVSRIADPVDVRQFLRCVPWVRSVRDPALIQAVTKYLAEVLRHPQTSTIIKVPPMEPVPQLQKPLRGD